MQKLLILIELLLLVTINVTGQIIDLEPSEGVRQVKWSPDGTKVATANPNGEVRIWGASGQLLMSFVADPESVRTVDWHPYGTRLATSGEDGVVKIWDLNGTLLSSFDTSYHDGGVSEILWHPDGIRILVLNYEQGSVWDSSNGQYISRISVFNNFRMNFSPNNTWLAINMELNRIMFYVANDLTWAFEIIDPGVRFSTNAWHPDSHIIATGDYAGTLKLWDVGTKTYLSTLVNVNSLIQDIVWSPDGTRLAIATSDGHVYTVDSQLGDILGTITANGPVLYADWQPGGNQLAYVGVDNDSDPNNDLQIVVPPDVIACDLTIPASDTTALIAAITSGNNAGSPQTLCLTSSTYTLNAVDNTTDGANGLPSIVGDITIIGNGATIVFASGGGFAVAEGGTLTLLHLTVISAA